MPSTDIDNNNITTNNKPSSCSTSSKSTSKSSLADADTKKTTNSNKASSSKQSVTFVNRLQNVFTDTIKITSEGSSSHNLDRGDNDRDTKSTSKMNGTTMQQHIQLPTAGQHAVHFNLFPTIGSADPAMKEKRQSDLKDNKEFDTYTLYLIRHGEAAHNILEKAAKKEALENCIAEGLHPEAPETKERVDAARQAVLNDATLFDAKLSDQGCEEAQDAGRRLKEIVSEHHLPPPEHVLVSPLTRTLETANYVFPDSQDIHVREELRERQTGKPPDTRSPSSSLMSRPSFKRFSMQTLRRQSMADNMHQMDTFENIDFDDYEYDYTDDDDDDDDEEKEGEEDPTNSGRRRPRSSSVCSDRSETEEDKHMLRDRTNKLLHLLAEAREQSVAVVTHKGYLRELERGPFGYPEAKEFSNCEIRVYQVRLQKDKSLDVAQRLV